MATSLSTELYSDQEGTVWPKTGRHILAHYDDTSVVVYQAFCPEIACYAIRNGMFGGPKYSFSRMTWIKTNFLWMMYRSGWATKPKQDRILAIFLKREGFDEILRSTREGRAVAGSNDHGKGPDEVRLQWDPDHHPNGAKLDRRAIQLGLRGQILATFNNEWVLKIEDVTDFVKEQHRNVTEGTIDKLITPRERPYFPTDKAICRHIRLDEFDDKNADCGDVTESLETKTERKAPDASVEGACCAELCSQVSNDDVILCLGGAFNPVHTRHIQCMVETKKWLEDNIGYKVIAGILAVAPDGYVKNKCKIGRQKCIKGEHRIKLCELACRDIDWLAPYKKTTGSAFQGGKQFLTEHSLKNVKLVVIVGADRAISKAGKAKWHTDKGVITVCVGREGETKKVKEAFENDEENGRVKTDKFYFMPNELDNVSSTEIRRRLFFCDDVNRNNVDSMVEMGWLHAEVGAYVLQNESGLFIA